jgi:hypothetical protein
MSKIWIFGDSYGTHLANNNQKITPWFWAYSLGKRLNCTEYKNFSQWGVGNDYIHHEIDLHAEEISPQDYVIVITSSSSREWLIEEQPTFSNFYVDDLHKHVSRDQYNAIVGYANNLQFYRKSQLNFKKMLGSIHYMTDKFNWNLIAIPGSEHDGFPVSHRYTVKGSLFDVCYNEFKSKQDTEWFYNKFSNTIDRRAGHLTKNNHKILEDKLYNTFTNNKILDLTTSFEEKIISKNNTEFLENQISEYHIATDRGESAFVPGY